MCIRDRPLAVIVLTAAWIYGLMGWFRLPFTLVSVIIGPLVLGITLGNLVYMMGRFYEEFGMSREPRQAAHKAVLTVGVAIFLACITTFFGFASFGFSDFDVLQEFGYMAAAGIGICFIFSVTFLPAMMIRREERRMRKGTSRTPRGVKIFSVDARSRIDRFLGRIADLSQGSPVAVVVVYGFVLLICVMGDFRHTTTPDLMKEVGKRLGMDVKFTNIPFTGLFAAVQSGQIDAAALEKSVAALQTIYQRNVFPVMNVTFGVYPDNIGHMASQGCFRCHDGSHTAKDGSSITSDCESCHRMLDEVP